MASVIPTRSVKRGLGVSAGVQPRRLLLKRRHHERASPLQYVELFTSDAIPRCIRVVRELVIDLHKCALQDSN